MKFVNKKRIASTVLAGAMALSMAAPAFAAGNETVVTATYNEVKIAVTIPATGKAIVNPFGLPVTMGTGTIAGEQIVTSAPLTILNKSGVDLQVGASVKATATGTGVTLLSSTDTEPSDWATETDKKIKVNFEAFAAPTLTEETATDTETTLPLFAALKSADALVTASGLNGTAQDTTNVGDGLILRKANADGELQAGGAGFFRLSGKAAKKPTTAWATSDGFTATITFSFDPATYSMPGGTFNAVTTNPSVGSGSTATLTFNPDLPSGVTVSSWTATSSDTSKATVKAGSSATKFIVEPVATGKVTITVTGTGSDGMVYSGSVEVTIDA